MDPGTTLRLEGPWRLPRGSVTEVYVASDNRGSNLFRSLGLHPGDAIALVFDNSPTLNGISESSRPTMQWRQARWFG